MKYIADDIGNDFKEWFPGQSVFLESPTGSGKTTFIFDTLLPYYAANSRKILYLVNRSVLKKQLKRRVENLPIEMKGFIQVETYQAIEEALIEDAELHQTQDSRNGYNQAVFNIMNIYNLNYTSIPGQINSVDCKSSNYLAWMSSFDCVVCDECHYFLMDSNFNKNTILSYNFIRKYYGGKHHVFISATINDIKAYIDDGRPLGHQNKTDWFGFAFDHYPDHFMDFQKTYFCDRNYDYINLNFIKSTDEIINLIAQEKSKWLIFVDSKKFGEELRHQINELNKNIVSEGKKTRTVSFVTADYLNDEESFQQVSSIVKEEKQTADILISTSVLDNGINIDDESLRNLIIMADNETEFIQMLGRRRRGQEEVTVYAFLYDKGHFRNRYFLNNNRKSIGHDFMANTLAKLDICASKGQFVSQLNEQEIIAAVQHSRYLINNIFSIYDRIKYTHLSYQGMLYLNPLSVRNLDNLNNFYSNMIEQFESGDEDAFAKEIIRWLNLEEQFDLEYAKLERYEKSRKCVINLFEANVNKPLPKKEYERTIRKLIEQELTVLIESKRNEIEIKEYEKFLSDCRRTGRVITGPMMKFLREHCDIPYSLNVQDKVYTIIAVAETDCKKIQED